MVNEDAAEDALKAFDAQKLFAVGDRIRITTHAYDDPEYRYFPNYGELGTITGPVDDKGFAWYVDMDDDQEYLLDVNIMDHVLGFEPGQTNEDRAEDALGVYDANKEFKVGDRVQVVVNLDALMTAGTQGDVVRVSSDDFRGVQVDVKLDFALGERGSWGDGHPVIRFNAEDLDLVSPVSATNEDQAEDALEVYDYTKEFKVGDHVKVIADYYPFIPAGLAGVVKTVCTNQTTGYHVCGVSLLLDGDGTGKPRLRTLSFRADELDFDTAVQEDNAEDALKAYDNYAFSIGDRVEITLPVAGHSPFVGRTGTISCFSSGSDHVTVDLDPVNYSHVKKLRTYTRKLKLLSEDKAEDALDAYDAEPKEFKVGDKVIFGDLMLSGVRPAGEPGEVVALYQGLPGHYVVRIDSNGHYVGMERGTAQRYLTLVAPVTEDKAEDAFSAYERDKTFAVGDSVVVRSNRYPQVSPGQIGVITAVESEKFCGARWSQWLTVRVSDNRLCCYEKSELDPAPIKEDKAEDALVALDSHWAAGDRVKIIDLRYPAYRKYVKQGLYGTILRKKEACAYYDVKLDAHPPGEYDTICICSSAMERAYESLKEDQAEDALKALGDTAAPNQFKPGDRVYYKSPDVILSGNGTVTGFAPEFGLVTVKFDPNNSAIKTDPNLEFLRESGHQISVLARDLTLLPVTEDSAEDALKALDDTIEPFKKGDRVLAVSNDQYRGYTGTVMYATPEHSNLSVRLSVRLDNVDGLLAFYPRELARLLPVTEDSAENALKAYDACKSFELGDKVRVIGVPQSWRNVGHALIGRHGTVSLARFYAGGMWLHSVDFSEGDNWNIPVDCLEPVMNEDAAEDALSALDALTAPFKVGDQARVRQSVLSPHRGELGTVTWRSTSMQPGDECGPFGVELRFDYPDGPVCAVFLAKDLECANNEDNAEDALKLYDFTKEFKVGDLVRVHSCDSEHRGRIGHVTWTDPNSIFFVVRFTDVEADTATLTADDIEHAPVNEDNAEDALKAYDTCKDFKIGDHVILRLPKLDFDGHTGIIVSEPYDYEGEIIYDVTLDRYGDTFGLSVDQLDPAPLAEDKAEDALRAYDDAKEFSKGDRVKIVGPPPTEWHMLVSRVIGLTGVVTSIVTSSGENYHHYKMVEVRLASERGADTYWNLPTTMLELVPSPTLKEDNAEDALTAYYRHKQFATNDRVVLAGSHVGDHFGAGLVGTVKYSGSQGEDEDDYYYVDFAGSRLDACGWYHVSSLESAPTPIAEDAAEDALNAHDDCKSFAVGDRVAVLDDGVPDGAVSIGRIVLMAPQEDCEDDTCYCYVAVDATSGVSGSWYHPDVLELAPADIVEDNAEDALAVLGVFSVGERVRVVGTHRVGTVRYIDNHAECYHVQFDPGAYLVPYTGEQLAWAGLDDLAEDSAEDALRSYDNVKEFKVGDKPSVVVGRVTVWTRYVVAMGDCERSLSASEMEPAPVTEDAAEDALAAFDQLNIFAVGDHVAIVGNPGAEYNPTRMEGVIVKVTDWCAGYTEYRVKVDSAIGELYFNREACELEPVAVPVTEDNAEDALKAYDSDVRFKLGDKVLFRPVGKELLLRGLVVEVEPGMTNPDAQLCTVRTRAGKEYYMRSHRLKLILPVTEDNAEDALNTLNILDKQQPLKVGDRVLVGRRKVAGVIVAVIRMGGLGVCYSVRTAEEAGMAKVHTAAMLTRVPPELPVKDGLVEDNAEDALDALDKYTELQVGDRVKVLKSWTDTEVGRCGRIVQKVALEGGEPDDDTAMFEVRLDGELSTWWCGQSYLALLPEQTPS